MTQTPLETLAGLLNSEEAAAILVAASRRLGQQIEPPAHVVSAKEIVSIPDRARIPFVVPQWTDAAGKTYGVEVVALTLRDKIEAEQWATDEKGKVNELKRLAFEVWRMIANPRLKSPDPLLDWNLDILYAIHNFGSETAAYPAQLVEAELARLAGQPAPEPVKHVEPNIPQQTVVPDDKRPTAPPKS